MKKGIITMIDEVIESGRQVNITLETTDFNGVQISVVPVAVEEGDKTIILYSANGVFTVDATEIDFDADEEEYHCIGTASVMTLSVA